MGKYMIHKIEDAVVKSPSLNLKSVTIGDRKMTLSVFKQIVIEEVIDKSGKLKGPAYGKVHLKNDDFDFWVIWQKGNELRKCPLYREYLGHISIESFDATFGDADDAPLSDIVHFLLPYTESWKKLNELPQLFIAV